MAVDLESNYGAIAQQVAPDVPAPEPQSPRRWGRVTLVILGAIAVLAITAKTAPHKELESEKEKPFYYSPSTKVRWTKMDAHPADQTGSGAKQLDGHPADQTGSGASDAHPADQTGSGAMHTAALRAATDDSTGDDDGSGATPIGPCPPNSGGSQCQPSMKLDGHPADQTGSGSSDAHPADQTGSGR